MLQSAGNAIGVVLATFVCARGFVVASTLCCVLVVDSIDVARLKNAWTDGTHGIPFTPLGALRPPAASKTVQKHRNLILQAKKSDTAATKKSRKFR